MNVLVILISLLFTNNLQNENCKLDVTELIVNAKIIGEKEFKKDFTGQLYQIKTWKVYNYFIDKAIYNDILTYSIPGLSTGEDSCELILTSNDSISIIQERLKYANNEFNQVELQRPFYNFEKNAFSTIIWVRDQSWMGGFCVLVYFNIEGGKCKFICGESFIVSDDQF